MSVSQKTSYPSFKNLSLHIMDCSLSLTSPPPTDKNKFHAYNNLNIFTDLNERRGKIQYNGINIMLNAICLKRSFMVWTAVWQLLHISQIIFSICKLPVWCSVAWVSEWVWMLSVANWRKCLSRLIFVIFRDPISSNTHHSQSVLTRATFGFSNVTSFRKF